MIKKRHKVRMLNVRTLLFGLVFGLLDSFALPVIKSVSQGLNFKWMIVPFLLYSSTPFIFLKGLEKETLVILNLVWDLTSVVLITLTGFFFFHEMLSPTKIIGVLLSFFSLFLMTYEAQEWDTFIDKNVNRLRNMIGF
jgi:drug/metabolite transporter (DMT)-like permease